MRVTENPEIGLSVNAQCIDLHCLTASALLAALTVSRRSKPFLRYRALRHLFPRAPYISRMVMKVSAIAPPITRVASSGPYRRCSSLTTPAAKFKMNSSGSIKSAAKRNPLKIDQNDPKKKAGQHHPFFTASRRPLEFEYTLNSLNYAPIDLLKRFSCAFEISHAIFKVIN